MPLYTYKCTSCSLIKEIIMSLKERDEPMLCPACSAALGRELTAGSFRFLGGSPTNSRPGV